ncbi:transducin family protein / WD-40 repeat family protein [Rhynchospora pubera]|uniref:Transducin family protein / WD-40 repeat family protein n=1 Tax=Rhynchospora pubera TaxID=906938 RepID=A0AAV8FGQ9_9POAL|nr:transducin family protein / WD-40 repeat family protein [Rhynchospora pubera]
MEENVDERDPDTPLSHPAAIASTEKKRDGVETHTDKSRPSQQDATGAGSSSDAMDLEFVCCLLQPPISHLDSDYVAIRRVLLLRKAQSNPSALPHRKDWRCNGRGYVAYRNFIRRPRDTSQPSTPSHSSGRNLFETDSFGSSRELRTNSLGVSRRISFSSTASDSERMFRLGEPAYSFVGMHCIFDNCKFSVTILKFGHMSSDLLAYGASDGSLTICQVSEPASVLHQLKGHTKDITDFDFTSNNQYLASSSMDKTIRVWDVSKGNCIRVVYGVSSQLCIRFHPVNNNFLLVGNSNKEINVINFSTGRVISKLHLDDEITALDNDHTGQIVFAGDAQGCVYTVSVNSHTGSLSRTHKNKSMRGKLAITTVQYRTFSLVARCPVLLVCAQDGNLSFFSVAMEAQGYLTLVCSLKLAPRIYRFRASFCPLLSLEKGEFIVSGSEDSNVYFYDLTRPKHSCVNKLQGHGAPVIGVAWNHGENLLASSDSEGMVIVWKRAKI